MIVSKTPLRISFAGGGTDLPSFYRKHGFGAVFSASIDKYIYVTIKNHSELYAEKIRLNYSDTEQVNTLDEIQNPIIRECLKFLNFDEHLYISTVADAPGSSGLGSSSTFCVGLLNALYAYKGQTASRGELAEEAAHLEIDVLKRPMGKQDHYAAAFGGVNYIRFNDDETSTIMPITVQNSITQIISSNLLTFWTGIERNSEDILHEQDKKNSLNSEVLIEMRDQALDMYKLASSGHLDIESIGSILHEGWLKKCSLASNITNSLISEAYQEAISCGALGGKISGAGGGGFLNLIVPEKKKDILISAMKKRGLSYFPINLETQGASVTRVY
jgi:D-glycero-alpha-D-manno-heptose-7-phosphate kinase